MEKDHLHKANGAIVLSQNALSTLSEHGKLMAKSFLQINKLTPFPLDAMELISWAKDVEEISGQVEIEKLEFIFKCFKTDKLEWDKNKGIQNIFNALKSVKKTEYGYKIKDFTW